MPVADIIEGVLDREKGLVDNPHDHGGITNHGITKASLSEWLGIAATDDDIRALTIEDARRVLTSLYVEKPGFDRIVDPVLQELVVDCGVLHGRGRATRWLQAAAGAKVDGKAGSLTLAAVNAARPLQLYLRICAERWRALGDLVAKDPTQIQFLRGWCNRGAGFLDQVARPELKAKGVS